jgi:DNA-binding MarR family transcriptional regulator
MDGVEIRASGLFIRLSAGSGSSAWRHTRVRMSALAAYLGLDRSTMSGRIDRAEKRELVARTSDPSDGRAIDKFLTGDGAELAATSRCSRLRPVGSPP